MATGIIQKDNPTEVIRGDYTNVAMSTTLSYTGISIDVTAGRPYILMVNCVYAGGAPLECYLSYDQNDCQVYNRMAGGEISRLLYGGIESRNITFYVWARYLKDSSNEIHYILVYL